MKTFALVTEKPWHDALFIKLQQKMPSVVWTRIKKKDDMSVAVLENINPDMIFIPHWSDIIAAQIYQRWKCVLFHMTDLPYGRGGSPLQNLIVRGFKRTKISAIKVAKGIDTGDVYLKKDLSLEGTAIQIFTNASSVIYEMILEIIDGNIEPAPQTGEPVIFARRRPDEGNLAESQTTEKLYDFIRMLDCEGYPKAFIEMGEFRLEFDNAKLLEDKSVTANVRIFKK